MRLSGELSCHLERRQEARAISEVRRHQTQASDFAQPTSEFRRLADAFGLGALKYGFSKCVERRQPDRGDIRKVIDGSQNVAALEAIAVRHGYVHLIQPLTERTWPNEYEDKLALVGDTAKFSEFKPFIHAGVPVERPDQPLVDEFDPRAQSPQGFGAGGAAETYLRQTYPEKFAADWKPYASSIPKAPPAADVPAAPGMDM